MFNYIYEDKLIKNRLQLNMKYIVKLHIKENTRNRKTLLKLSFRSCFFCFFPLNISFPKIANKR